MDGWKGERMNGRMNGWMEWMVDCDPIRMRGGREGATEIELILEASRTGLGWVR